MADPPLTGRDLRTQGLFASVTRIAHLTDDGVRVTPLPREEWATGDYVLAEVVGRAGGRPLEIANGRTVEMGEGDLVVGALGRRFATLDATGSWEDVGEDGLMEILTGGGVLGRCRTLSALVPELVRVRYRGHLTADGGKRTMAGSVRPPPGSREFRTPVVLITGTSMSAGKTAAARVVIRRLRGMGVRALGAKLTGAGRYRDILAMSDSGAATVTDFVDAGLPSTYCPPDAYRPALEAMLGRMAESEVEVAVVEIGASPLEPYNGRLAMEAVAGNVAVTILCATDPYAVAGAVAAYGAQPDLVTGIVSNTEAGVRLVERLNGLRTLNLRHRADLPALDALLRERLDLPPPEGAGPVGSGKEGGDS